MVCFVPLQAVDKPSSTAANFSVPCQTVCQPNPVNTAAIGLKFVKMFSTHNQKANTA